MSVIFKVEDSNDAKSIAEPLFIDEMTKQQFDSEVQKGMDSIEKGEVYSWKEVGTMLINEFNL